MILEKVRGILEGTGHRKRPVVTLSWAQSLNGAITSRRGEKTVLSDTPSLEMVHQLRSLHQGILVGIGTVLADDPLLNVRLVSGPSPIPLILDTKLRIPLNARIFSREDAKPWIFHTEGSEEKKKKLQEMGAWLFQVPWGAAGVELKSVLEILKAEGISSLLVEGGASVHSSFLRERDMDQAVITLCPLIMDGLTVPDLSHLHGLKLHFHETQQVAAGKDMVFWGKF